MPAAPLLNKYLGNGMAGFEVLSKVTTIRHTDTRLYPLRTQSGMRIHIRQQQGCKKYLYLLVRGRNSMLRQEEGWPRDEQCMQHHVY